jgi:hypothetical protein
MTRRRCHIAAYICGLALVVALACGDLLVGYRGQNLMIEVKDGGKPPSARKLTSDQVDWHDAWRGQVIVVKDVDQALAAIGVGVGQP